MGKYVNSYAKIFLILYPPLENSTTCIAILTGEKPAKKWVGIEKEERRKFYSKVKKNLNLYHLGQSTVYDSILEVIKSLIQRDYPKLDIFDGSEILQIYIPEIWLNQCPRILGKCAVHVIIEVF